MTSPSDLFTHIAAERRAIADVLDALTPEQLATQSLCGCWTVQDVGGHLIAPIVTSLRGIIATLVAQRGSFDRANDALSRKVARRGAPAIARTLREQADHHFTPPGSGPAAPLTDLLVHGQDIRRPLGISREFDEFRLVTVLTFLGSPPARRGFVRPKRIAGLRFVATDVDYASGAGPVVEGTGEQLLLAYTGRPVVLAELTGEGAAILAGR